MKNKKKNQPTKSRTKEYLDFIKSNWLLIPVLAGIAFLYTYNLEQFPIFADEAIYLHWAKRVFMGDENPFISMFDGKPPLFIWAIDGVYYLTGSLLLSGRLVSVLSVWLGSGFLFLLMKKYMNSSWAWVSLLLLLTSPFVYFHSRLALMDTMLAMLLLLAVMVWSVPKIKYRGIITGILLGLAFMVKTPAIFVIPLPLVSAVLVERKTKSAKQAMMAMGVVLVFVLFLKTSVWFPNLFGRSQDFTYQISDVLHGQLDHIGRNFYRYQSWMSSYESWLVIGLALVGMAWGVWKRKRVVLNLSLAFLMYNLPFILLGKVLTPRYYLFSGMVILVLAAFMISRLYKWVQVILVVVIVFWSVFVNIRGFFNSANTHLVLADKQQYLMDWSSGFGIRKAAAFFKEEGKKYPVKVLSEGYFGTLPDGLFIELDPLREKDNLTIVGVGTPDSSKFMEESQVDEGVVLYYIGNENRIPANTLEYLELEKSYGKVSDGPPLQIYKIKTELLKKTEVEKQEEEK